MIAQTPEFPPIPAELLDAITQALQQLSPEQQQQVLDFAEFLVQKSKPRKPAWEKIRELSAQVPDGVWAQVPTDGAVQHDHYLYSVPKQDI